MKALLVNMVGLSICWYFADISSPSLFAGKLAPFGVFIFLVSLLIIVGVRAHRAGLRGSGGGTGFDLGGGDDCGGGGCD